MEAKKLRLFRALGRMWKQCFRYRGRADRREFWLPFAFHAGLAVLTAALLFLAALGVLPMWPVYALLAYLTLSLIPGLALTVRRLHDTGRRGYWALLLFAVGIGTVAVLWLCAGEVSAFVPFNNINATVYGPPEWFDPGANQNVDVYGPPSWFQ